MKEGRCGRERVGEGENEEKIEERIGEEEGRRLRGGGSDGKRRKSK